MFTSVPIFAYIVQRSVFASPIVVVAPVNDTLAWNVFIPVHVFVDDNNDDPLLEDTNVH